MLVTVMATKKWFSIYTPIKQFTPVQQNTIDLLTNSCPLYSMSLITQNSQLQFYVCVQKQISVCSLDVYWMFIVCAQCGALELKLKISAVEFAVNLK